MGEGVDDLSNAAADFWLDEQTCALPLMVLFIDRFDEKSLQDWHPATIYLEVCTEFKVNATIANFDKLMAAKAVRYTDLFYSGTWQFIALCNALSGHGFGNDHYEPADALECAWGLTEASLIGLPADSHKLFDPSIRIYIDKVCDHEGLWLRPDVLKLAGDGLTPAQIRANLADLPEIYEAAMRNGQQQAGQLVDALRQQLRQLYQQLEQLPLQHGNTKDIVAHSIKALSVT